MEGIIAFRNVVRYVKDLEANSKLYQAVGFKFQQQRGDMHILKNDEGLTLVLHQYALYLHVIIIFPFLFLVIFVWNILTYLLTFKIDGMTPDLPLG